jgi:ribosomal protein S12 methylthiotransferase
MDVLVDDVEAHHAVGRSYADAPEIDGSVFLDTADVRPGDRVSALIRRSSAHDLWASVDAPTRR